MRSDCGDIRFTDSDATTLLSYWLEWGMLILANTRIWVKSSFYSSKLDKNDLFVLWKSFCNKCF